MAGNNGIGTATIGEVRSELKRFLGSLSETSSQLNTEIQNIRQSAADIRKEYDAGAKDFARNTLTELDGPSFDKIAELALGIKEVTGQSLTFYRQELINKRDSALKKVNAVLKETVDATTFPAARDVAAVQRDTAKSNVTKAGQASTAAAAQVTEWNKSDEHQFIQFDAKLRAEGKPGIAPETKSVYDTDSLITAVSRYVKSHVSGDETYRKVREVLADYDRGAPGRDAFADMKKFKETEDALIAAAATAKAAAESATRDYTAAKTLSDTLSTAGQDIVSDDEILSDLQEKLAGYLATPEFMKAVADEYGEDFPASLPLLAAKLKTLDSLAEDAGKKREKLTADIAVANKSYQNMSNADSNRRVQVNLDEVRRSNQEYRNGYSTYTGATSQYRQQTTCWGGQDNTVWNVLLLDEILEHDHASRASAPAPIVIPNMGPFTGSNGSMDLDDTTPAQGGFSSSGGSPFKLDVSLDSLFQDVASNNGSIDLSPPPAPPPPPAPRYRSNDDDNNNSGGFSGFGGGGGSSNDDDTPSSTPSDSGSLDL